MDNLRAIALMVAAMASFALTDLGIKLAAADMPVAQILVLMSLGGTPVFILMTWRDGDRVLDRVALHPVVMVRNAAEIVGSLSISLALALAPLSLVTAITQAMPLVVTLGAALLFKEKVGPRRWAAVVAGLCGVLIILRPDASGLSAGVIFALLATLGLATRDLATRKAPKHASNAQLSTYGFVAVGLASALILSVTGGLKVPSGPGLAATALATVGATLAYFCITKAMRIGEVSAVTPFRYTRLIFGLVLGITIFGETVDAWILVGSGIVIGSGLFVLLRERQLARRAAARA